MLKNIKSFTRLIGALVVFNCVLSVGCATARAGDNDEIVWKNREGRWSIERAKEWYDGQPWIVGANFIPSSASNQFEMWQADTFDPETIDRELGWAEALGFNTVRVFLHDMLWKADPKGFEDRIDQYLSIAEKHRIRTLFVLFDSCWDPRPKLGRQEEPIPGVHNSRWVQSPHIDILKDQSKYDELRPYVYTIMRRFRNDGRVLGWDLLNEPGNLATQPGRDEGWTAADKSKAHAILLTKLFAWARDADPSQPLTVDVWQHYGVFSGHPVDPLVKIALEQSDIITFHLYASLIQTKQAVTWLRKSDRPIICSEYMARSTGSEFKDILPYFKKTRVGAINWGLVSGRSQTIYPWSSWNQPYSKEPDVWFHDIFRKDGAPFAQSEVDLIRELTGKEK